LCFPRGFAHPRTVNSGFWKIRAIGSYLKQCCLSRKDRSAHHSSGSELESVPHPFFCSDALPTASPSSNAEDAVLDESYVSGEVWCRGDVHRFIAAAQQVPAAKGLGALFQTIVQAIGEKRPAPLRKYQSQSLANRPRRRGHTDAEPTVNMLRISFH
jgi:hypothetical protein